LVYPGFGNATYESVEEDVQGTGTWPVSVHSPLGAPDDVHLNASVDRGDRDFGEYCAVRYESPISSPLRPSSTPFAHINLPSSPIREVWARRSGVGEVETFDPSPTSNLDRGAALFSPRLPQVGSSTSSPDLAKVPDAAARNDAGTAAESRAVVRSLSAPRELTASGAHLDQRQSLMDLAGTRPYSPPVVLVGDMLSEAKDTRPVARGAGAPCSIHAGQDEIEVIFDPGIGCYYDPKTNKYYALDEN